MGFFDRLSQKKQPANPATPSQAPASESAAGGVIARLAAARDALEAKDLPGALAIYDEVLASSGDRADVLVTISGDLGVNGHVAQIIELIAPRYDAERHGPATGINLLQAYLAQRDAEAAQHVLDLLFALNRPDLEERLHGFSNAIAELLEARKRAPAAGTLAEMSAEHTKVNLASISKPIWFYGLEPMAAQILPTKGDRLRRVAFAQLANLGYPEATEAAKQPDDECTRLSRAIPLWFAETFTFSPHYAPIAAVGLLGPAYAVFNTEWTTENLRQLLDTSSQGLDYIFTGALRHKEGDFELILRVWEVKKFRERKQFLARWTPATADAELAKLHEQMRVFMEWTQADSGLAYAPPASPTAWLRMLATSLSLFFAEKNLLAKEKLTLVDETLAQTAAAAPNSEAASLAFLTLRRRAERLSLAAQLPAALASSPLIAEAQRCASSAS